MQDTVCNSKLWIKTSLTVLPGLWIVIWQSWIMKYISTEFGSIVLGLIVVSIVGINFVLEQHWDISSFPALGALFWLGWEWLKIWWQCYLESEVWIPFLNQLYNRVGPFLQTDPTWLIWTIGIIFLIIVPYTVYSKSGLHIEKSGWKVLGVLIFVTMIYISLYSLPVFHYPWFLLYDVFKTSLLLTSVFLGYNLAKHRGILAVLLIVICEPIWIDMFLNPLYVVRMYLYELPNVRLHLALFFLTCLPWFGFLIITPVGIMHSRTQDGQRRWLLLLPLLTLISMEIVRSIALQDTISEYSISMWLRGGLKTFQLWLPLWLAIVLYAKANVSDGTLANKK